MTLSHPYEEYENSELWIIVEKALEELVRNKDIILCTRKEYIIGYLLKSIMNSEEIDIDGK
ncbi:MAG: hypothetical protein WCJ56_11905 [bacterium]